MTRAEQNAKVTADLYKARSAAKFLLGDSYAGTLRPYREFIARVMVTEGLPVLRAVLKIGTTIPPSDPIPLMCLLAAGVELMEVHPAVDAVDPHAADPGKPTTRVASSSSEAPPPAEESR